MSKPNGKQPIQRLAKALKPTVTTTVSMDTEELAAALQDCLDSAVERGTNKATEEIRKEFGPRFDKQDETLRMVWRQCGGDENKRLPIDD